MMKFKIIIPFIVLAVLFSISITACQPANTEQETIDRSGLSILSIDQEAKAGDIIWKVEKAEYLGSEIPSTNSATLESRYGRFINVEFTVENTGSESRTIIDLKAIDSQGREFPVCAEAYAYYGLEQACLLVEILPGLKQTFTASFDVPLDAIDLIFEVSDLNIPPVEKVYIDLGV